MVPPQLTCVESSHDLARHVSAHITEGLDVRHRLLCRGHYHTRYDDSLDLTPQYFCEIVQFAKPVLKRGLFRVGQPPCIQ